MKSFLRTFFVSSIFGSIVCSVYFGWARGLPIIWSAVVGGLVIGFSTAVLARIQQNRVSESSPLLGNEKILRKGRASYDDMAGWLYLTDRRLLFEGYPGDKTAPAVTTLFDEQTRDGRSNHLAIPILQITDVGSAQPFGIESRLTLVLSDGTTRYFSTEDLADWLDDIGTARQKYLDRPMSEEHKLFPAN